MSPIFFDGWPTVVRTLVVAVLGFCALVALLRLSGKRTLAKMNAFDLVVTVALGSSLASLITSKTVALTQGVLAFAALIGLQYCVTWLAVRSRSVRRLVKNEPALLLLRGEMLEGAMRRERVTEEELRAAIRARGIAAVEDVEALVLETDGNFSVVSRTDERPTALRDVQPSPGRIEAASGRSSAH